MVSKLASRQSCPGFESQLSGHFFRGKIVDVADVNQRRCLEESGWCLEHADQTHLVLASDKLLLQIHSAPHYRSVMAEDLELFEVGSKQNFLSRKFLPGVKTGKQ